jgi:hypothetical protein
MDGGVADNLGVEGLKAYLELEPAAKTPGLLIISDMSAELDSGVATPKLSPLKAARRALEVIYQSRHNQLLLFHTGGWYLLDGNIPPVQPYEVSARGLWGREGEVSIFVLRPTSEVERSRFGGHKELVDRVSKLDTLKELSAEEAHAAFWVGAKLAHEYLQRICQAAKGAPCPIPSPPAPSY